MLRAVGLEKAYEQPESGEHLDVLRGVDLDLQKGESLAVVGSSGIGKSTLLHCLGLIDELDKGEIYLANEKISHESSNRRAEVRRLKIGFVFQFHYLMAELTALENVMIPLLIQRKEKGEAEALAENWLKRVGLAGRLRHRPAQLSGGEQQRVAIARALVHRPELILADEPTGNLDPETARQVFDVLTEQCQDLKSILVMATHNFDLAEKLQRKTNLLKGKLV